MGGLSAAAGTYDIVYSIGDAFDGGDNDVFGLAGTSRFDNTVAYQSPTFAGLQVTACTPSRPTAIRRLLTLTVMKATSRAPSAMLVSL